MTDARNELVDDIGVGMPEQPTLIVAYPNKTFKSGETLDRSTVTLEPAKVGLKEADDDALYTVVFVDPDAPSKEEPDERCFLHWAFGNIKGVDLKKWEYKKSGQLLMKYITPAPPRGTGPHRYVFLLFKQTGDDQVPPFDSSATRTNFDVKKFVDEKKLENPASGWLMFFAENAQ